MDHFNCLNDNEKKQIKEYNETLLVFPQFKYSSNYVICPIDKCDSRQDYDKKVKNYTNVLDRVIKLNLQNDENNKLWVSVLTGIRNGETVRLDVLNPDFKIHSYINSPPKPNKTELKRRERVKKKQRNKEILDENESFSKLNDLCNLSNLKFTTNVDELDDKTVLNPLYIFKSVSKFRNGIDKVNSIISLLGERNATNADINNLYVLAKDKKVMDHLKSIEPTNIGTKCFIASVTLSLDEQTEKFMWNILNSRIKILTTLFVLFENDVSDVSEYKEFLTNKVKLFLEETPIDCIDCRRRYVEENLKVLDALF